MSETWYICVFNFQGITRNVETQEGIHAYSQGFWINEEFEYTKASDCKYWIPPSQILHVEKDVVGVL